MTSDLTTPPLGWASVFLLLSREQDSTMKGANMRYLNPVGKSRRVSCFISSHSPEFTC